MVCMIGFAKKNTGKSQEQHYFHAMCEDTEKDYFYVLAFTDTYKIKPNSKMHKISTYEDMECTFWSKILVPWDFPGARIPEIFLNVVFLPVIG